MGEIGRGEYDLNTLCKHFQGSNLKMGFRGEKGEMGEGKEEWEKERENGRRKGRR